MKVYPLYQVDVFTKEYYGGNPAAVCVLDEEIEEELMKKISAEMNLSETAFLLPLDKKKEVYSLRWFTPQVEVDICGHGTIGTSKVIYDIMNAKSEKLSFKTKSGDLIARKCEDGIGIDMPLDEPLTFEPTIELLKALGLNGYKTARIGAKTGKVIIEVSDEAIIHNLKPNFEQLKDLKFKENVKGVAVTTNNCDDYDFVSRYFNPWAGINEDPVTGSVHTVLATYWGELLDKKEMKAFQASYRGGELILKVMDNNRLELIGDAVITLKGEIYSK
ncbi:PhzF family phenazine biosynthesis protein [Tissierella sp. Yu-01]|uniref:PhzF family phenazine biosynthesis protein n=1 Tax=Tissierella sp. Yu-01 TaxID=3035694 RepID=UPI00240CFD0F|nr:PhzF family phenazine biosynthesis protein [Tissierella sp. Yu-01]WFA07756.1 PhzF family phenazine biosynthesis protein [Tissierella sp. Yu-01]